MNGQIGLVILFIGFVIGVGVTIAVYSTLTWRRIREHWKLVEGALHSDAITSYLAVNITTDLFAWQKIRDGKPEQAAQMLASQIASFSSFISRQKPLSPIPAITISAIKRVCAEYPDLKLLLDQSIKENDGKSIDQIISEIEKDSANKASEAIAPQGGAQPQR